MTRYFWSSEGHIGCDNCKPYEGSDTWRTERWQRMNAAAVDEMAAISKRMCGCPKGRMAD